MNDSIFIINEGDERIKATVNGRIFMFSRYCAHYEIKGAIRDILAYENEINRIKEQFNIKG